METKESKSFFDMLSAKQAFWLGGLITILVVGTIGCVVMVFLMWHGNLIVSDSGSTTKSAVATNSASAGEGSAIKTDAETLYKKIATEIGLDSKTFDACRASDKALVRIQTDQASAVTLGVKGTPSSFIVGKDGKTKQIQGGAVAYSSMKALIDQELGNTVSGTPASTTDVSGSLTITSSDHVNGDSSASIMIVTYSDFQSPYCSRFDSTMQQIMKEYSGKVKWVYRYFPLSFHDQAQNAAEAAECASEQGKFWEYAAKLFANQSSM